jgi:hypothetical protein
MKDKYIKLRFLKFKVSNCKSGGKFPNNYLLWVCRGVYIIYLWGRMELDKEWNLTTSTKYDSDRKEGRIQVDVDVDGAPNLTCEGCMRGTT